MENFAINLLGAGGQVHAFKVSACLLAQVYQTLMEHGESEKLEPFELANTATPVVKPTDNTRGVSCNVIMGTKPGYVELYFSNKPAEHFLRELRSGGFHWNHNKGCWWGSESKLPARWEKYKAVHPVAAPLPVDKPADKPVPVVKPVQVVKPEPSETDNEAFAASLAAALASA